MQGKRAPQAERVDYKKVLSEEEFALFSTLRVARKQIAEKEAIPAYSVFTNEQLAQMVKTRPTSATALGKISGVGEARVSKYGAAFLELLSEENAKA